MPQTLGVDAVADAVRKVPFRGDPERGKAVCGVEQALYRDEIVLVAVHQQHGGARADLGGDRVGALPRRQHQEAGIADDRRGRRRRRPTWSAIIVPWLKPTSASASSVS